MGYEIIDATDVAEAMAEVRNMPAPWWATLDAACWTPEVAGAQEPERGAARAMLVGASLAGRKSLGRWWREAVGDGDGLAVRMPDGRLLTPVDRPGEPTDTTREWHAISSALIAQTDANLTYSRAQVKFDCACRHTVTLPASPHWGSTKQELAELVTVLAWELTMRRGSPRTPPTLVGGLAAAFALSRLGVDPASACHIKARIVRPSCLGPDGWRTQVTDDPDLMLSGADEAELVAEELLLPVRGIVPGLSAGTAGPGAPGRTDDCEDTGSGTRCERHCAGCKGNCGCLHTCTASGGLGRAIKAARVASNALAGDAPYARGSE